MQTQLTLDLGIDPSIDVQSLIIHGNIEQDAPKAKREQPAPEFERVLMDGADSRSAAGAAPAPRCSCCS